MANPELDFYELALKAQREGRMCMTPPEGFRMVPMNPDHEEVVKKDDPSLPNEPLS